jgi:hypothetical protein
MTEELLSELSAAMRYNPDLTVQEVIKLALSTKNPTRNYWASPDKKRMKYKATNSDILTALRTYNTMRQKDSNKYLENLL